MNKSHDKKLHIICSRSKDREREREKEYRERRRSRSRSRDRNKKDRRRSRSKEKDKSRGRDRSRDKESDPLKVRDKNFDRSREKDFDKSKERWDIKEQIKVGISIKKSCAFDDIKTQCKKEDNEDDVTKHFLKKNISKKEPLSLEELLAKKKAEEDSRAKPKFLSKEERVTLALQRRQDEVDTLRKDHEERKNLLYHNHELNASYTRNWEDRDR